MSMVLSKMDLTNEGPEKIQESRGQISMFRSGSHLFLEVSVVRRYNDLQTNRRFPERGSVYDCRKTR